MEGLKSDSAACRYIAERLGDEEFTLIDVGCSGGIDRIWRLFGSGLRAIGFDPNVDECSRLNAKETLQGVRYIPAFVGLPPNHPITQRRGTRPYAQRNPWHRLSVAQTIALRQARTDALSSQEIISLNQWMQASLADPAAPVVLPDFFREHAIDDIDVLKIDVDGADFDILQLLGESIRERDVLAVGLEVNFIGSHDETDHTFHNTDRFMRALGFDLFGLTVRPYSAAALPARYQLTIPAQSQSGRPLQGDALYVRDLGDPARSEAHELAPAKLAKLCAIYACFGLYDCAAEVLVAHRQRLSALLDVDEALDVLCAEAQGGGESRLSYQEYLAAFQRDESLFYAGRTA